MNTAKLYDEDAYLRAFTATVTGCVSCSGGWQITLDRTAFYPEGGGQPADTGLLGGVRVLDVQEREGEVLHLTDAPLEMGRTVEGTLDWAARFSRMQQHTGEHTISGILHRLYRLDNVGFHMGHDAVTIDLSGEVSAEQLQRAERLANEAIWADAPVRSFYPSPAELAALDYRSKKALTGAVRIVRVEGCDLCACCGTHLSSLGQVGAIKLLTSQRYKGGTRVWLLCGDRALEDADRKNEAIYSLSELLSSKPEEVVAAAKRLVAEQEAAGRRIAALQSELFARKADAVEEGATMALLFEDGMQPPELRRLCLALMEKCRVAAVFSGEEAGWRYAVGSAELDVRPLGKALNAAFSGRGGGQRELVQGALVGGKEAVEDFFRAEANAL